MNLEICEKCKNERIDACCLYPNDDTFGANVVLYGYGIMCFKDVKSEIKVLGVRFYIPSVIFDKIQLNDKTCPYYLEHSMYDWSRKNEQRNL